MYSWSWQSRKITARQVNPIRAGKPIPRQSKAAMSAAKPGESWPISSRPNTAAPRVALVLTCGQRITCSATRCSNMAWRASFGMSAVIRCRSVDAKADVDSSIQHFTNWGNAACKPHVRTGAVVCQYRCGRMINFVLI